MCLRGCRARVRGSPCVRQLIASPIAHGWLMVWADRILASYMNLAGCEGGHPTSISPHHAPPQHVQAKAGTLGVIVQGP